MACIWSGSIMPWRHFPITLDWIKPWCWPFQATRRSMSGASSEIGTASANGPATSSRSLAAENSS